MKRVLLALALMLGCAMGTRAQSFNPIIYDPTNFTVFGPVALSAFSGAGGRTYNINMPLNTGFAIFTIPTTTNADTVLVAAQCSADVTSNDQGPSNGATNPYAYLFVTTQLGAGVVTGAKGGTTVTLSNTFPDTITVWVMGCSRMTMQVSSPTGTLSDNIKMQGQLSNMPVTPFGMGGPPTTVGMGVTAAGAIVPITVGTTGTTASSVTTSGAPPGDAVGTIETFTPNSGGTNIIAVVGGYFFNGATWDRQFYCNKNASAINVVATTLQIISGVAGQKIRLCSIIIERNDVTGVATTLKLVEGTGANCGTGQTTITGNLFTSGATAVTTDSPPVVITMTNTGALSTNFVADAACVQTTGAASSFDVTVVFEQH